MRDDFELLEAWRAGDEAAGNELFDRHFGSVYRFFSSKTPDTADDLVQHTFLACVEGRDRFRGDAAFRAYLFGVARRVFYRHLEHRARDRNIDYEVSSLHDLDPSPSELTARRNEEKLVLAALRRLPVDQQVALELYYVQGLRGPEVAEALDIPEATVRSRIRRALDRMRVLVAELTDEPGLIRSTLSTLAQWSSALEADEAS